MTTVGGVFIPTLVSEREPTTHWNDCTWASGLMLANAAWAADHYPPTQAEYEALRWASGDLSGGSNIFDLERGMDRRYGWSGEILVAWTQIAASSVGTSLALQGLMSKMPPHYRRWDTAFGGAHCVHVTRTGAGWWWQDPLATWGYPGEPVTQALLYGFFSGQPGAHAMRVTVGSLHLPDSSTEDDVDARSEVPIAIADYAAGGTVYADLASTQPLIGSWAGAKAVGVYDRAKRADGKVMNRIRVDFSTGGKDLRSVWVGQDKATNFRLGPAF